MTDEERRFLWAILADDGNRAAYCDWLDEAGRADESIAWSHTPWLLTDALRALMPKPHADSTLPASPYIVTDVRAATLFEFEGIADDQANDVNFYTDLTFYVRMYGAEARDGRFPYAVEFDRQPEKAINPNRYPYLSRVWYRAPSAEPIPIRLERYVC